MTPVDIGLLLFFPGLLAFAACSDLVSMTISNRISLALAAGFLAFAMVAGLTLTQVAWHMAAGMTVLTVGIGLFAMGWVGGGDVKLASAVALWFGFGLLMDFLLVSAVFGAALTIVLLYFRSGLVPAFALGWQWVGRLHHHRTGVPYGIALAAAALLLYPQSPLWRLAIAA
jgi:prepilin peptidase CpaA